MLKQVFIHVDNRPGRVYAVMKVLTDAGINARALSIADDGENGGIIRLIVDNAERAVDVLKAESFMAKCNDVIGFVIPDKPGGLCEIMRILGDRNINIKYSYSVLGLSKGDAGIVIRVNDNEKAISILKQAEVKLIAISDII